MKRIDKIEISDEYYKELKEDIYFINLQLNKQKYNLINNVNLRKRIKTITDFVDTYLYLADK